MKRLYPFLCICLLISCSQKVDDNPSHEEPEIPNEIDCRLKLAVKENVKNIFEPMEFSLSNDVDNDLTLRDLHIAYDSITWMVKGVRGQFRIYDNDMLTFRWRWSHCFYLPGNYETYLVGYKGNKVVYGDTLQVSVFDRKDFLGRDWDETTDLNCNITYRNILDEVSEMQVYAAVHQGIPSIELTLALLPWEDGDHYAQRCDMQLYDYINSLYGQPAHDRNSSELVAKYAELFAHRNDGAEPCAIWLTSKSRIVLLRSNEPVLDGYWVYAEPQS